ncbi:MAG: FAD-binding oxidoreductase [Chloroflexi bacterium]|nr:FAD-binding oxidoreductase [Chloroflexota bacterium]
MPNTAEAVIIGGGVMGCSILYNLAEQGVTNTLLLERDVLASGSTSKSQAILRMHYSNEVTSLLAWKSLDIFKNFEEITGMPSGYTKTGYFLIVGQEDRQALFDNVAMHRRLGIASEVVSIEDLRELAPMLAVEGDESFAYESESGYADPYSVTLGFANRAREMGARFQDSTPVTGIEVSGDRVTAVLTADGRVETPIAVITAGPWSDRLLNGVGVDVPIRPLRHQVVVLRRPPGPDTEHPIVADNLNGFSARPDIGGLTMIGAGEEEFVDADTFNQGVDMNVVEPTFEGIVKRIPAMSRAVFRGGWSGAFTVTPDWHPVLDHIEGIEGLYCAVGFSGHGFKESPMIGKAMAELITQGSAACVDISMLNLNRFETGDLLRSRYAMQVLA